MRDGCEVGKEDGLPWPPPEDRRVRWNGACPVSTACWKSGFYQRQEANGDWVPCGFTHPGAVEDAGLVYELDWDQERLMFVRTNLTEAINRMRRMGLFCQGGWYVSGEAESEVVHQAGILRSDGIEVAGYVYYTSTGEAKKRQGRDFKLHYGQCQDRQGRPYGLTLPEVGSIVMDSLSLHGVRFYEIRPGCLLVEAESIEALE
jgi:hypothetical protein